MEIWKNTSGSFLGNWNRFYCKNLLHFGLKMTSNGQLQPQLQWPLIRWRNWDFRGFDWELPYIFVDFVAENYQKNIVFDFFWNFSSRSESGTTFKKCAVEFYVFKTILVLSCTFGWLEKAARAEITNYFAEYNTRLVYRSATWSASRSAARSATR